jgi:hypothetical protein
MSRPQLGSTGNRLNRWYLGWDDDNDVKMMVEFWNYGLRTIR